jgi:signal transduction histidine kinase
VRWDEQDRPLRAAGTTLDVTRRHDAAIRSHRLQNLREITSDVLNSFLKTEDLSVAIDMILNRVGTAFGVSRSYLFRYRNDLIWMSNTHEWCAHGVEPQIDNLQQLPASEFPWWNRELESGRTINIANLAEAELDEATRDVLESQDIKALLVLPVMINGKLEGFFGFDETSQPRAWHDEETALLSVMVEAYSRAVERTIARRVQSGTTRLLAEALERAEEASQAQASFLARMSHEIRTPLSGITGLGRALARTELDDGQREFLRALLSSANSLRDIIGDILDFSKISERKLQLQTQAVNPVDLLEDVAQTYAASARAKGLTLYCDLAPTLPVSIMVDPVHLRQVVGNLLSNAVKFTPDGAISLEAGVARTGDDGLHLEIRVTDTGIGIDAETLPMIFEPFVQADHSTRRRFEGTGLGLAIVRQLIELMGGAIDVTSEPGRGSVFCCRLRTVPPRSPAEACVSWRRTCPSSSRSATGRCASSTRGAGALMPSSCRCPCAPRISWPTCNACPGATRPSRRRPCRRPCRWTAMRPGMPAAWPASGSWSSRTTRSTAWCSERCSATGAVAMSWRRTARRRWRPMPARRSTSSCRTSSCRAWTVATSRARSVGANAARARTHRSSP